ncbi:hypothetical protein GCM10017562_44150 [Streptomyces roseofulvus]|uniref:hypothetical protein n=1 Tax=Streptomyces roseofulvus TaxID=33902 RepID=UPI0031FC546C
MEDHLDGVLLRDALDRTADALPPLPDLVPLAVREGRRRRARSRLAAGTAAFAVVTAGALGLALLPGAGPGVPTPAASTVDGEGLSAAERERRARFQQRMAALLDERLPANVTGVRPVEGQVSEYAIEADGEVFRMVVSVRKAADLALRHCEEAPAGNSPCERDALRLGPVSEWSDRVTVGYQYRRSQVTLIVYGGKAEAPVNAKGLFTVTGDPRFLELVREADADPMEPQEPPLTAVQVSPGEVPDFLSEEAQRAR